LSSAQCDLKNPFQQLGPAQPHRTLVRTGRLALGRRCSLRGQLGLFRQHLRAHRGVACENAMEANQVQPRAWHQGRHPLHELQPQHHQVRGAVSPRALELEHHLPDGVGLHALVGQSGARDAKV